MKLYANEYKFLSFVCEKKHLINWNKFISRSFKCDELRSKFRIISERARIYALWNLFIKSPIKLCAEFILFFSISRFFFRTWFFFFFAMWKFKCMKQWKKIKYLLTHRTQTNMEFHLNGFSTVIFTENSNTSHSTIMPKKRKNSMKHNYEF